MFSTILKSIAEYAVGIVFDKIKERLFKPDTSVIDNVVGGFDRLEHLIKTLDYENRLLGPMTKINFWVMRIKDVVDKLNDEDNLAHREEYNNVVNALKSESDGIRFQTYSLYTTLTTETHLSPEGLVKFWANEAYKKLANEKDVEYCVDDYIRELDTNIAAVAALLHHGLELSMFICATEEDAEEFRKRTQTWVESFRDSLYQRFYPPALRQIKSSYDDPGAFLTDGRWFNLYDNSISSNRTFLTIHDYWIREIGMHTPAGDSAAKLRAFRFAASNPQRPLGPLEMHAYWESRGKTRVLFYHGQPELKQIFAYTNSDRMGDTDGILFKLIPVQVESGNEIVIKLIPYKEDGGSKTRADEHNTWGNVWRLAGASSLE